MTDSNGRHGGVITYDDRCGLCGSFVRRFRRTLESRGFAFLPIRCMPAGTVPTDEMGVLTVGGGAYFGADAVFWLARRIWWAAPLGLLGHLPMARRIGHRLYKRLAAHRHCMLAPPEIDSCPSRSPKSASRPNLDFSDLNASRYSMPTG